MDFLVYDYTKCTDRSRDKYEIRVVSLKDLFDELHQAKADSDDEIKLRIAVYEIGGCLLDWS